MLMKQSYFTLLFILLIAGGVGAQVQTRFLEGLSLEESGIFGVPRLGTVQELPKIDLAKLMEEDDLQQSMAVPFRFGYAMDVNYSVSNSGRWYDKPEGRIWKLNLRSEGAYSINHIFDQLVLQVGGELYIYNGERTMLQGPLTAEITNKSHTYGTDLIQGDFITLELF